VEERRYDQPQLHHQHPRTVFRLLVCCSNVSGVEQPTYQYSVHVINGSVRLDPFDAQSKVPTHVWVFTFDFDRICVDTDDSNGSRADWGIRHGVFDWLLLGLTVCGWLGGRAAGGAEKPGERENQREAKGDETLQARVILN
jgi:hypothetical protein